jgi:putative transcriptional regulator
MESLLDILIRSVIVILWKVSFPFIEEGGMKNRLEELRKKDGIKQEELAAALEVSRQTIGSLENGRYNPSILLAFKIAKFFGVTIEEVFIYEEEER